MKCDNAENQRARIAPGLDRHGIVWSGCRGGWWGAAGRIGCQRAYGAFGDAEGPVIDGGICVPAMRQRCCPWGDVRLRRQPRAAGVCSGQQQGQGRGPSVRWRLAMPGAAGLVGWLDWFGDGSKPSFRAEQSAAPESMTH
ncbi:MULTISPECIES: hypothetical protein [Thalassospira]|uniref:hypothetical protein n=1 Tax=Thalassospira TaxID=168934 RepID=UPI0011139C17|nr:MULTISPECIES: hypothetical protein [Thalassospira]MDM7976003.1 hypothetical protein [Thalassospira xiamenensis]